MPRWDTDDEPEDEEDDDVGADDDEPTLPCPYCRREILEDAERCPYCGSYISREDAPPARKPWWLIIGVVIALYAVYRWTLGH